MPKCSISPPTRLDRRRDDVAPVGDGGSAEHDHQLGTGFEHLIDRRGQRRRCVWHAPLGDDGRAGRRNAGGGDLEGLVDDFWRKSRQQGRHNADLAHLIRRHADDRLSLPGLADRLVTGGGGYGKRYDLHGGDHLAFHHRLERRQRGNRHRLVDAVEAVDRVLVEHQHTGGLGEQIAAPRKGAVSAHTLAFHGKRDIGRGLILGNVARLKLRDDDFLHRGGLQRGDFRRPDQRALLEHEVALANRMHRGGAERLGRSNRAEFHAASAFSDFMRSRAVISAMMEMAISAGDTAPIASPIGAWMRAISASVRPASFRR